MARLTPLHLYGESKNVKPDGDLKVHHLPSMWRIDLKVFSALKEHVFPFWTNSSKIAPCSLSIYSALSDLQLLVTEEQIPRGITFWLKVNMHVQPLHFWNCLSCLFQNSIPHSQFLYLKREGWTMAQWAPAGESPDWWALAMGENRRGKISFYTACCSLHSSMFLAISNAG